MHNFLVYLTDMGTGGMIADSAYGMQGFNDYDMYEEPDKMTYTEQANKRSNCRRLTRYFYCFMEATLCGTFQKPDLIPVSNT